MMTRVTAAGRRVVLDRGPLGWHWTWDHLPEPGGPFPTLAAAIADAQARLGADVAVVRHSDPDPPR